MRDEPISLSPDSGGKRTLHDFDFGTNGHWFAQCRITINANVPHAPGGLAGVRLAEAWTGISGKRYSVGLGMVAGNNITLSEPLLAEPESAALTQPRSADEMAMEAVSKDLQEQKWTRFVERNNQRAVEMGISEEDIPRLVAEVRSENRQRGRE